MRPLSQFTIAFAIGCAVVAGLIAATAALAAWPLVEAIAVAVVS